MDAQDTYMDVGGRVMQEQLPSDVVNSIRCEFSSRHSRVGGNPVNPIVIPALNRYDVHGCINVAVIWISKSDPVNNRYLYSF